MRVLQRPARRCCLGAESLPPMERLLQLIDELDDLVALLRHRFGIWPVPARRG